MSADSWRHSICDPCWGRLCAERGEPGRSAVRVPAEYRDVETCCFCGAEHRSGIYVRGDPKVVHADGAAKEGR
jgi:hypothetical protein